MTVTRKITAATATLALADKADYSGRSKVALPAYKNPKTSGQVTGRIYGLAR
jgi:hypothetical protein